MRYHESTQWEFANALMFNVVDTLLEHAKEAKEKGHPALAKELRKYALNIGDSVNAIFKNESFSEMCPCNERKKK